MKIQSLKDLEAIEERAKQIPGGRWAYTKYDSKSGTQKSFAIERSDADQRYIFQSQQDIPALCAALREAWSEVEFLKEEAYGKPTNK